MARLRLSSVLVAALLLPTALAWDQVGGNAAHNAAFPLAPGALDVLGHVTGRMAQAPFWGAGMLDTPEGLIAAMYVPDGEGCALAVFDDPLAEPRMEHALDTCRTPILVAYDEPTHAAILCRSFVFAEPVLEAVDVRDGKPLWTIGLGDVGPVITDSNGGCLSAALDVETRELFVAAFVRSLPAWESKLLIVDVDTGTIRIATPIPGNADLDGLPTVPLSQSPAAYIEEYHGVTLTDTGVVLSGYVGCGPGTCNEGVAAWLSRDGAFVGKARTATGDPTSLGADSFEAARGMSRFAAVRGPAAAFLFGRDVVLLNPQEPEPVHRAPVQALSREQYPFLGPAVWSEDVIVVALVSSLVAVDDTLQPRWAWTEGVGSYIMDVAPTTGGQLLVTSQSADARRVSVTALDRETGQVAFALPLPFVLENGYDDALAARVTPVAGGSVVYVDTLGHRVLLGVADPAEVPTLELSDPYPAPGAPVVLTPTAPAGARVERFVAFWDNGATDTIAPGESFTHVFPQRGDHDVRVLAVHDDGTTRSAIATVHVGGTPPAELTTLQKAFSAEYQNWTFFVLGTLITIVGLAITVGRNRRRFSKLERELNAVEEIRMLSIADPRAAIVALKSYRDRLPEDLARRRIDDSQYHILDIRSARLLKVLRTRLFAPYDARLSQRYHRLLEAAFEDAILQPSEREALVDALAHEDAIALPEREEIARLLTDFTSDRADLRLA